MTQEQIMTEMTREMILWKISLEGEANAKGVGISDQMKNGLWKQDSTSVGNGTDTCHPVYVKTKEWASYPTCQLPSHY